MSEELRITSIEKQGDGTDTIKAVGKETKKKYTFTGCYPISKRTGLDKPSKTVTLTYNYAKSKAKAK